MIRQGRGAGDRRVREDQDRGHHGQIRNDLGYGSEDREEDRHTERSHQEIGELAVVCDWGRRRCRRDNGMDIAMNEDTKVLGAALLFFIAMFVIIQITVPGWRL